MTKSDEISPTDVTLFSHPGIALVTLGEVLVEKIKQVLSFSKRHWLIIGGLILFVASSYQFESLYKTREIANFCFYWIILGVASSIGLGTGLHTFVLYLGPHIAKVAMTATECGYVPEMIPSRWSFDHFRECTEPKVNEVSFQTILFAVQLEAFLWGLGTALGELPPYFIARHAAEVSDKLKNIENSHKKVELRKRLSQEQIEEEEELQLKLKMEVEEVEEENSQFKEIEKLEHTTSLKGIPLIEKVKVIIFKMLQKYGFITVLLCASIPNPLFDLAGITCGHFKIPFKTFFSATFIGKAIIKVHIQMLFIITLFRKQTVESVLRFVQSLIPSLGNKLIESLQNQKKLLFAPESFKENKPLLSKVWNLLLIVMIGYFVISILNTSIQHRLVEQKHETLLVKRSSSLKMSRQSSIDKSREQSKEKTN